MFETLNTPPEGIADAEELVAGLDACFMIGFSRLGEDQLEALGSLARAFTGTPLAERLDAAVDGFSRAQYMPEHFLTLAAARQSLHGAIYDALADQVAMGEAPETPGHIATWMESSRQWLVEVALNGFLQLEMETVSPFMATLEQLQDTPEAGRLSMVLTGWINELLDSMPIAGMDVVPRRRWVDLWTRCMVSAISLPPSPSSEKVSGTFSPLGADVRNHPNAISAVVYGVLDAGGEPQLVRTYASSYKVDVVSGDEIWRALEARYDALIDGLAGQKIIEIEDMTLLSTGDMIWDGTAKTGRKKLKPFDLGVAHMMAEGLSAPEAAPMDRHPVQLCVPVFVDGYKVAGSAGQEEIEVDGLNTRCDAALVSDDSSVHQAKLKGTSQLIALLRYDAGWSLQPLVVGNGSKVTNWSGDNARKAKSSQTIAKLQERASKLLRAKS